jgi:hypothetical protein
MKQFNAVVKWKIESRDWMTIPSTVVLSGLSVGCGVANARIFAYALILMGMPCRPNLDKQRILDE